MFALQPPSRRSTDSRAATGGGRRRAPAPAIGGRGGAPAPPPPPTVDAPLAACATGWAALISQTLGVDTSRAVAERVLAIPQRTFEDCVREPIGGLLDLTSVLCILQVALLGLLAAPDVLEGEDRARAASAAGLTSIGVFVAGAIELASGAPASPEAAGVGLLAAATAAASAAAATSAVDAPASLLAADAAALLPFGDADGEDADPLVSTFYRGSTIIGLLVGASFIFSPVSPISIFDEESAATLMLRQDFGFYVCFIVAAVEARLFRFAAAGELSAPRAKALNVLAGLVICLLVNDGLAQVKAGTAALQALDPSDPFAPGLRRSSRAATSSAPRRTSTRHTSWATALACSTSRKGSGPPRRTIKRFMCLSMTQPPPFVYRPGPACA